MLQHYLSQGPSSDLLNQIAHFFNFWVRIWIQEMLKASDNGLSVVMSMFGPLFPLNINFSYFPVLYLLVVVVFASKPTKAKPNRPTPNQIKVTEPFDNHL